MSLEKRSLQKARIVLTFDRAIDKSRLDVEKYIETYDQQKYAPLADAATPVYWEIERLSDVVWDYIETVHVGLQNRERVRFGLKGVENLRNDGQNVVIKTKSYGLPGGNAKGLDDATLSAVRTPEIIEELGLWIRNLSHLSPLAE